MAAFALLALLYQVLVFIRYTILAFAVRRLSKSVSAIE